MAKRWIAGGRQATLVSTTGGGAKRDIRETRGLVDRPWALDAGSPDAEPGLIRRLTPVRNCRISGTRRAIRPGCGNPLPDTVRAAFPQLGEEWLPDWGGVANLLRVQEEGCCKVQSEYGAAIATNSERHSIPAGMPGKHVFGAGARGRAEALPTGSCSECR